MLTCTPVTEFKIREGTGPVVMSRVLDWQNVAPVKAQISAITWYVYDLNTSDGQPTLKNTSTAVVDTSWFNAMQTLGWSADTVGYNVAVPIPAVNFTAPTSRVKGTKYKVEIIGAPQSGDTFWIADIVVNAIDGLSRGTA